ncbi:pyridoxal kinase [Limoniibacter endophyticus]|uniref:pyridoxal kinase n=1 Tax=Limoniibacter endophyticus TaxID=1565040 RepID=A0A8J3DQG0_9HYPH|nr:pyridoxal kinase [Limoniibacter endophyticus]GHC73910.1 pyridoxal kinase [Limoniibacter endophyticus]
MKEELARYPTAVVISSNVVRGSVGNRAVTLSLELLGVPVWAVPTIVLAWHPGISRSTRIVAPDDDFSSLMADLARAPWLPKVGGLISGYLGSAEQARGIAHLVGAMKAQNPEAIYVCDPVIGDLEGIYVPEETAVAIRDRLLPLADYATPNRFELAWLADRTLETQAELIEAARALPCRNTLVTSAPGHAPTHLGNLLISANRSLLCEHPAIAHPPKGPGDVTGAVFLGQLLQGASAEEALSRATSSVYEAVASSAARGSDELMLETDQAAILCPRIRFGVTSI